MFVNIINHVEIMLKKMYFQKAATIYWPPVPKKGIIWAREAGNERLVPEKGFIRARGTGNELKSLNSRV